MKKLLLVLLLLFTLTACEKEESVSIPKTLEEYNEVFNNDALQITDYIDFRDGVSVEEYESFIDGYYHQDLFTYPGVEFNMLKELIDNDCEENILCETDSTVYIYKIDEEKMIIQSFKSSLNTEEIDYIEIYGNRQKIIYAYERYISGELVASSKGLVEINDEILSVHIHETDDFSYANISTEGYMIQANMYPETTNIDLMYATDYGFRLITYPELEPIGYTIVDENNFPLVDIGPVVTRYDISALEGWETLYFYESGVDHESVPDQILELDDDYTWMDIPRNCEFLNTDGNIYGVVNYCGVYPFQIAIQSFHGDITLPEGLELKIDIDTTKQQIDQYFVDNDIDIPTYLSNLFDFDLDGDFKAQIEEYFEIVYNQELLDMLTEE